jgi:NADPH:quinone reductase
MRVVWMTAFGPPSVLVPGEAPEPSPADGQVVVDVAHANITFVETQFRATGFGPFRAEPPLILGNGVGGTVAGGRRVIASLDGTGGYAERVAVDADRLIDVPAGLALDDAVALLADGRTAVRLLRTVALRPGERVLVEAAAGGGGTLLVQLAKAAGAEVVGVAGGARKVALVERLGADAAVDYLQPDWPARAGAVDVVLDGVGGAIARAAFGLLRPGGRMHAFGAAGGDWSPVTPDEAAAAGVTLIPGARPDAAELRACTLEALAEAAAGRLAPAIGQRFPLERAADAHAAIESRATLGKTLLDNPQPS